MHTLKSKVGLIELWPHCGPVSWDKSLAAFSTKDHTTHRIDCDNSRRELVLANVFRAAPQGAASARGTKKEVYLPIQGTDYLMHRLAMRCCIVSICILIRPEPIFRRSQEGLNAVQSSL
jgi:hypothetical protein